MTTGRINQVTILPGRRPAEAEAARNHPEGWKNRRSVGGRSGTERPARGVPGAQGRRGTKQAIQLPPLSSPRNGPPQEQRRARWGHLLPGTCAPRVEDTSRPSRPGGRLWASVGPRMPNGNDGRSASNPQTPSLPPGTHLGGFGHSPSAPAAYLLRPAFGARGRLTATQAGVNAASQGAHRSNSTHG